MLFRKTRRHPERRTIPEVAVICRTVHLVNVISEVGVFLQTIRHKGTEDSTRHGGSDPAAGAVRLSSYLPDLVNIGIKGDHISLTKDTTAAANHRYTEHKFFKHRSSGINIRGFESADCRSAVS